LNGAALILVAKVLRADSRALALGYPSVSICLA
jgi:hypothetical protein